MQQPLLILGASVRAAAHSAIRAGFSPIAADVFSDVDLAIACPTSKVTNYPDELEFAARQTVDCPWMYTGALENHPQLVDRISASRPLFGNSGKVLREVRDPMKLAEALSAEGISVPKVRRPADPPQSGEWLIKPVKSAGGLKIKHLDVSNRPNANIARESRHRDQNTENVYYQEFIDGVAGSAVYLAAERNSVLLGVTRQFCKLDWIGAPGFVYAGSFGPIVISNHVTKQLQTIGECLARRFNLVGLFGVDLIFRDEEVWPLELNPRYTASVEVIERATSIRAVSLHVSACRDGWLPEYSPPAGDVTVIGKAIKYATSDIQITTAAVDYAFVRNHGFVWPSYADIPSPGTSIAAGKPVASIFSAGKSVGELECALKDLWNQFEQRLA